MILETSPHWTARFASAPPSDADAIDEDGSYRSRAVSLRQTLHSAIQAGSQHIVQLLLIGQNSFSLLRERDCDGRTPLIAAVHAQNIPIVQKLLTQGARGTIDLQDKNGNTAIFVATQLGNHRLTKLLLEETRSIQSINRPNSQGETALSMAIQENQLDLVELLIVNSADVSHTNVPDKQGVTVVQRAARSGNVGLIRLLLNGQNQKTVQTNPEAYFTARTLRSCLHPTQLSSLNQIPLEQFAEPLTVFQNFCNSHIRMRDGSILILENSSAEDVFKILTKQRSLVSQVTRIHNSLTLHLSPGHGFLHLKCDSCNHGKSYDEHIGFYPTGKLLKQQTKTAGSQATLRKWTWDFMRLADKALPQLKGAYVMLSDQGGTVVQEGDYEKLSFSQNQLKITAPITEHQAQAAFNHIETVSLSCQKDPEQACRYNLFKSNCVGFVQDVFNSSGFQGYFADFLTDEQLQQGYFQDYSRAYEFKAIAFANSMVQGSNIGITSQPSEVGLITVGCSLIGGLVVQKIAKRFYSWITGKCS